MARTLSSYIDTFYFSEFQRKRGGICPLSPLLIFALTSASADVNIVIQGS